MGRASRKVSSNQEILQQYRDAGWDEESLRIWFGGEMPQRKKDSLFFQRPQGTIKRLLQGKKVSPASYEEVLVRANWNAPRDNLQTDPVFEKIFQVELRRLGQGSWIGDIDKDLLKDKFAALLGPDPPHLLEAAAEIDPAAFEHVADDILARKIADPKGRQIWAREEFATGLDRILDKQGSREWSAARHKYLQAVWDTILKESGSPWSAEIEYHYRTICGLLRRGQGRDAEFTSIETEEGLLPEEALFRDAVRSFLSWGIFREQIDEETVRDKIVPLISRQIFSQLAGRPVADSREAAEEIAEEYFFPGVRNQQISGSPFGGLRPLFAAEDNLKAFAELQSQYTKNRVWPTRDTARNALHLFQAVEGATDQYLASGPPPPSWSSFLSEHILESVMR